jgi:hypothetical protein
MPQYRFDVVDGQGRIYRDDEGLDLPSAEAARKHALREARGVLAQEPAGVEDYSRWEIRVSDSSGGVIMTVRFADACGRGNGLD